MSMYCLHGLFHFSYSKLSSNSLYLFDCSLKEFTVVFNENSKFFLKQNTLEQLEFILEKMIGVYVRIMSFQQGVE